MNKGILNKTKCYLVGNIENDNSPESWRDIVVRELSNTGIIFWTPLKKPFLGSIHEDIQHKNHLFKLRAEGKFDEVSKIMKWVRIEDLVMVDKCDFIIAKVSTKIASWGSAEEIFWSNREKKKIFLIIEEGKVNCPLWLLGTIKHQDIYNNINEVINEIKAINSGEKEIDYSKWKIFSEDYR